MLKTELHQLFIRVKNLLLAVNSRIRIRMRLLSRARRTSGMASVCSLGQICIQHWLSCSKKMRFWSIVKKKTKSFLGIGCDLHPSATACSQAGWDGSEGQRAAWLGQWGRQKRKAIREGYLRLCQKAFRQEEWGPPVGTSTVTNVKRWCSYKCRGYCS